MYSVQSNGRSEVVAEEELEPSQYPEEETDAVEDGGVLETEAEVHRVMAGARAWREVAAVVISPLDRREGKGGRSRS